MSNPPLENVTIIIPTYNEQDNIAPLVAKLQQAFKSISHFNMNILIFDSNSTDNTQKTVHQLQQQHPNLHLSTEPQKTGLGSAYAQAIRYAIKTLNADIVFEFDADGSHDPKYLAAMLEHFTRGADVVFGSRYVKGGSIPQDWAPHRKFLSVFGNLLSRIVLSPKIRDYTTGFRGTRTKLLRKIDLSKLASMNYTYKIQLIWELYLMQAKMVEFPIAFIDRENGYSKLPKNNTIDSLKLIFKLRWQSLFKPQIRNADSRAH